MATTVPTLGHTRVKPSVNFNKVAQTISKTHATNNNVHAIPSLSFVHRHLAEVVSSTTTQTNQVYHRIHGKRDYGI